MTTPNRIDFHNIASQNGSQPDAFEELCCQVARNHPGVPAGSEFIRYRGAGGDGGVECIWRLPSGEEWGWQAKYMFDLPSAKSALDDSLDAAIRIHPRLTRFYVCLPFDLTGPTGRTKRDGKPFKNEQTEFEGHKKQWEATAKAAGVPMVIELQTAAQLLDALLAFDPNGGRLHFWFTETVLSDTWLHNHLSDVKAGAGPRYTPELNVDTPIISAFDALGQTLAWRAFLKQKAAQGRKVKADWADAIASTASRELSTEFPPALREQGQQTLAMLQNLSSEIETCAEVSKPIPVTRLHDQAQTAITSFREIRVELAADIDAHYGPGKSNSKNFRQSVARSHS